MAKRKIAAVSVVESKAVKSIDSPLVDFLCKSQGLGVILARSIVQRMPEGCRAAGEALLLKGEPMQEIMNAIGQQPDTPGQDPAPAPAPAAE
jgi:hypothetical protein